MKAYRYLQTLGIISSLLTLPATAATLADDVVRAEGAQQYMEETSAPGVVLLVDAPGREGHGWGMNMSDDQLEKLYALKAGAIEATAGKKAQLHVLRMQLHDLMTRPAIDKKAIMDVQGKINALHSDIENTWVSCKADMAAVLSPEQRGKIRHHMLIHSLMQGFGHHHGMHGGCDSGCGGGHGGFGGHGMHGHHGFGGPHEHGHEGGHVPPGAGAMEPSSNMQEAAEEHT